MMTAGYTHYKQLIYYINDYIINYNNYIILIFLSPKVILIKNLKN